MVKTIEEMRKAVLAYCEEVCPQSTKGYWHSISASIKLLHHPSESHRWSLDFFDGDGSNEWLCVLCWISEDSNEEEIRTAYRMLGLETRDAVEAEKSRLLKRYKARIKRLRADDAETHRIQMEVKDERIAELQTRNAALVAALEKIRYEHGYRYTYGDGFGNVLEKRINSVGVAVVNALAANTEKGGVNG